MYRARKRLSGTFCSLQNHGSFLQLLIAVHGSQLSPSLSTSLGRRTFPPSLCLLSRGSSPPVTGSCRGAKTQPPCLDTGHLLKGYLKCRSVYKISWALCCNLQGLFPRASPWTSCMQISTSNTVFQENWFKIAPLQWSKRHSLRRILLS